LELASKRDWICEQQAKKAVARVNRK